VEITGISQQQTQHADNEAFSEPTPVRKEATFKFWGFFLVEWGFGILFWF
jgi:hypothetical protein